MIRSIYIASACWFITSIANAQFIRVPAGKKFETVTSTSSAISTNIMGQSMETINKGTVTQEYAVQNVTATGYTLSYSLKRIVTDVSVMGQVQHLDTNDSTTRNLPEAAAIVKELNRVHEIKIENGITIATTDANSALMAMTGFNTENTNAYEIKKFFLTLSPAQIKQGYSWADSSVVENIHIANQYIIVSTANQQVEVRVTTDSKINAIVKQSGIDVNTNLKTFSNTTRKYDAVTGLLLTETTTSESTGNTNGMGMDIPIIMKATISTTVL